MEPSTLSTVLVPRQAKVFTYSAEHRPAVTVEPGQRLRVETTSAFGEFALRPGDTLAALQRAAAIR